MDLKQTLDPLWMPSLFSNLDATRRNALISSMSRRDLNGGDILVAEGESSDALYIVMHGSFEVIRADNPMPIAEVHSGELIGEIGFLSGSSRTATVRALRDARVLELDRVSYDQLTREVPTILDAILSALAQRLSAIRDSRACGATAGAR